MVIYSSNRENNKYDIFDKLAGKDVWVKVKTNSGKLLWIKIIQSNKDTCAICIINDANLKNNYKFECSAKMKRNILSTALRYKKSMFEVIEPVEYLTTDEILIALENE